MEIIPEKKINLYNKNHTINDLELILQVYMEKRKQSHVNVRKNVEGEQGAQLLEHLLEDRSPHIKY